jgi:single-stranded DNA-binding protein
MPVESLDAFYLNSVTLCGVVGQYGITMRETSTGTPHARFDLMVKEPGFDDKMRTVYVTVEAWGKAAVQVSGLHPGQAALVEGKVARTTRPAKDPQASAEWYTTVQAWRVQAVEAVPAEEDC